MSPHARGRSMVLAAAFLWGTAGAAATLGPSDAEAWQMAQIRLVIGAVPLVAVGGVGRGRAQAPALTRSVVTAMTAMAVFQLAYFTAVEVAGVAIGTAVALGSAPVAAGAFQRVFLRVRPEPGWGSATALAVAGVVVLLGASGNGTTDTIAHGVAAGLVAGSAFGAFAVASRHALDHGTQPVATMGWLLAGAAVVLVPVSVVAGATTQASWLWATTPTGVATVAWVSFAATAGAYALFGSGLRLVPPASAATLALAEPVVAVAIGVGLLAERPTIGEAIGVLLVLAGLVILLSAREPAGRSSDGHHGSGRGER